MKAIRREQKGKPKRELNEELRGELRGELRKELRREPRGELRGELRRELAPSKRGAICRFISFRRSSTSSASFPSTIYKCSG
jgi:hypothetical protein